MAVQVVFYPSNVAACIQASIFIRASTRVVLDTALAHLRSVLQLFMGVPSAQCACLTKVSYQNIAEPTRVLVVGAHALMKGLSKDTVAGRVSQLSLNKSQVDVMQAPAEHMLLHVFIMPIRFYAP